MKKVISLASASCLGLALSLTACGKEKKAEPVAPAAATTDPATPAAPAGEAKPEETKAEAKGGW